MIDPNQVLSAYQQARQDLLAERTGEGHWVGQLSSSALSTATAISALTLLGRHSTDETRRRSYRQVTSDGLAWLRRWQRDDGGWGDTDQSLSNIATTMLVCAAFHLSSVADQNSKVLGRAELYVNAQGGVASLRRRYGQDKTFAEPILTNAALAGLVPWSDVTPLPFELACLPYGLLRFLHLPVVSYAVPALVAIGQARFFHRQPHNPMTWLIRRWSLGMSLRTLCRMQPASGGFLEAVPLTSFVVMSLAATGRADHSAARRGAAFLLSTMRADGSWPIDTDLATWNTTLAINALAAASGDVGALGCLDWLLGCQHRQRHPFTQAAPGGWGWSDLSGAVPDVDDTSGALLALKVLLKSAAPANHQRIRAAAADGVEWLLSVQNADGGWPTFCRGWGTLAFDRSGADLTAHALRALHAWRDAADPRRIETAVATGLDYLARQQRPDGSWVPLWFGNQHQVEEENPVYGTSRVLLCYRDLGSLGSEPARRGLAWLAANRMPDGGWSGGSAPTQTGVPAGSSSVEETAVALEALLAAPSDPALRPAISAGLRWLISAVLSGRHRKSAPIGFYFAKLWYYERLYPLVFTVAALGRAVHQLAPAAAGEIA